MSEYLEYGESNGNSGICCRGDPVESKLVNSRLPTFQHFLNNIPKIHICLGYAKSGNMRNAEFS